SAIKGLNFEDSANKAFSLVVRAVDQSGAGLSTQATVTINLTNANEAPAPTSVGYQLTTVATANTLVARITHRDPDAGNVMSYVVTNVFNWDTGNGSIASYRVVGNGAYGDVYTNNAVGMTAWQTREEITV